jgi:hypothetical protein
MRKDTAILSHIRLTLNTLPRERNQLVTSLAACSWYFFLFACFTVRPCKWRRHIPQKQRWNFTRLHGVIFPRIITATRASDPTETTCLLTLNRKQFFTPLRHLGNSRCLWRLLYSGLWLRVVWYTRKCFGRQFYPEDDRSFFRNDGEDLLGYRNLQLSLRLIIMDVSLFIPICYATRETNSKLRFERPKNYE